MPTATLRDLITRYAKWQEAGGVRQSIMISNRRGSSVSNEDNEADVDNDGNVIAWDFDTSLSDIIKPSIGQESSGSSVLAMDHDESAGFDTVHTRPLRSPSIAQGNVLPSSVPQPLPLSVPHGSGIEHPLEQLFNDGTVRPATAPPALRARKDTLPSRPVSPLPPLTAAVPQPANPDMDSHPGTALGMTSYDLRLDAPILIKIPATEETLRKDPPGARSRSATVTRGTRSDSIGSASFSSRPARHNAADIVPLPQPQVQSPPMSSWIGSSMPQLPLPATLTTQLNPSATVPKPQPSPLSPPKSTAVGPTVPPSSPTKGHIQSKSMPVNSPFTRPFDASDHDLIRVKSGELKTPKPPNLNLNVRASKLF